MFRILKDVFIGKKSIPHEENKIDWYLTKSITENINLIKTIFENDDTVVFRKFEGGNEYKLKFCLIFVDGMIDNKIVNENIIEPIMKISDKNIASNNILNSLKNNIIVSNTVEIKEDSNKIISDILVGNTILLVDGQDKAITIEAKGFNQRAISESPSESVVRGPRESFNENIMTNLTMVRRKIKTSDLKFKFKEVGRVTRTKVCICYIDGIANEKIIKEVNKRIDDIDIDAILESGYIEELIQDEPLSPFSTVGNTERPDSVAGNLLEGRIAIFIDGTPVVLTVPFVFIQYFQANEDYYNTFIYSSINRLLRIFAFFLSTSIPAVYVALTTFHQEMIPTPLLLGISAAREGVPFPTVVEALLMLLAFEILRESGVRLPAPIGSSISFVGALILGQAAVEARFVSAPIVIVTALTGLSNFLTPKMIGAVITIRLIFLVLSSFLGLYGYIFGVIGLFIHLMSMRSFGIPYMLNIGSLNMQEVKDTVIRAPWWLMYYRPKLIAKNNSVRKKDSKLPEKR